MHGTAVAADNYAKVQQDIWMVEGRDRVTYLNVRIRFKWSAWRSDRFTPGKRSPIAIGPMSPKTRDDSVGGKKHVLPARNPTAIQSLRLRFSSYVDRSSMTAHST